MKHIFRGAWLLVALLMTVGCMLSEFASSGNPDLSKVVLQPDEVPVEFDNQAVYGEEGIQQFFPLGADDSIKDFYGVSYLYPKDGINMIFSVVVVLDDEESAKSVYKNVTSQVKSQLHLQKNKFGDESLVFSTLSGTSVFSVWRTGDTLGYTAITTRLVDAGFGFKEIVAASKLVQSRLAD
jgi:hypothetical protein